jgi:hypothetical protein
MPRITSKGQVTIHRDKRKIRVSARINVEIITEIIKRLLLKACQKPFHEMAWQGWKANKKGN